MSQFGDITTTWVSLLGLLRFIKVFRYLSYNKRYSNINKENEKIEGIISILSNVKYVTTFNKLEAAR